MGRRRDESAAVPVAIECPVFVPFPRQQIVGVRPYIGRAAEQVRMLIVLAVAAANLELRGMLGLPQWVPRGGVERLKTVVDRFASALLPQRRGPACSDVFAAGDSAAAQ